LSDREGAGDGRDGARTQEREGGTDLIHADKASGLGRAAAVRDIRGHTGGVDHVKEVKLGDLRVQLKQQRQGLA
jgi:hypothetical protein